MSAERDGHGLDGKPSLELSRSEVNLLLLEAAPTLGLAEAVSAAQSEGRFLTVRLDLDKWEELAGHLSRQAYGTADSKRQDQIDSLIERIEDLIDEADEP